MRLINKQPITAHLSVTDSQSEYAVLGSSNHAARLDLDPKFKSIAVVRSSVMGNQRFSHLLSLPLLFSPRRGSFRKPLAPRVHFN